VFQVVGWLSTLVSSKKRELSTCQIYRLPRNCPPERRLRITLIPRQGIPVALFSLHPIVAILFPARPGVRDANHESEQHQYQPERVDRGDLKQFGLHMNKALIREDKQRFRKVDGVDLAHKVTLPRFVELLNQHKAEHRC
jgi:hypothetical protein